MRQSHALIIVAVVAAVQTALAVPLGSMYAEREAERRMTHQVLVAEVTAPRVSGALDCGGRKNTGLRQRLDALSREHGVLFAVRLDDGTVISPHGDGPAVRAALRGLPRAPGEGTRAGRPPLLPGMNDWLTAYTPLCAKSDGAAAGETGSAVLLAVRPADELRHAVLVGWSAIALLCLSVQSGVIWLVAWLRRSALLPLRRITEALRELSAGSYQVRAATDGGHEIARLAGEVNNLADSLQAVMERQRTFLADVAHQLRNPLVALRLRVETLATRLPRESQQPYHSALKDIDRLDRTLTQMLEHARSVPEDKTVCVADLRAVVEECVRSWAVVARQRVIRLRLRTASHVWVLTRPGAVEQALNVLLDNALKHAPEDSTVRIDIVQERGRAEIRVRNDGVGLTALERESAFERGWRKSSAGGSGLGLSIASDMLAAAGGRLELRSEGRKGLTAVVHLPGAAPAPEAEP